MKKNKQIVLLGGGGHCRSCIDVIELGGEYAIAGIIETAAKRNQHQELLGYSIIGTDADLSAIARKYSCLITVGQIKNVDPRRRLFEQLQDLEASMPVIISPLAHVSGHAEIGPGSIIMHGAIINAGARIGKNCIINSQALIEHDAVIADHCHISTGAIVNGGTIVGTESFLGSRSVTYEYIEIGAQSLIGGGTIVRKSIPEKSVVYPRGPA